MLENYLLSSMNNPLTNLEDVVVPWIGYVMIAFRLLKNVPFFGGFLLPHDSFASVTDTIFLGGFLVEVYELSIFGLWLIPHLFFSWLGWWISWTNARLCWFFLYTFGVSRFTRRRFSTVSFGWWMMNAKMWRIDWRFFMAIKCSLSAKTKDRAIKFS